MSQKQKSRSAYEYKPTKMLGKTLIGEPNVGHTETFLSIGCFDTEHEAENCRKYMQTKFFNAMLSTLKVTQNNPKSTFENIPLQDFTENSDIDWSASLRKIDQSLYRKYSLSDKEIFWIEQQFMRGEKNATERTKDERFDLMLPDKYTTGTCELLEINNWAESAIFDFWVNGIYGLWEKDVRCQKLLLTRLAYDHEERDLSAEIEEFRNNPFDVMLGNKLANK